MFWIKITTVWLGKRITGETHLLFTSSSISDLYAVKLTASPRVSQCQRGRYRQNILPLPQFPKAGESPCQPCLPKLRNCHSPAPDQWCWGLTWGDFRVKNWNGFIWMWDQNEWEQDDGTPVAKPNLLLQHADIYPSPLVTGALPTAAVEAFSRTSYLSLQTLV